MQDSKFDYQLPVDSAYLSDIEIQAAKLRAQAFANQMTALSNLVSRVSKGIVTWISAKMERSRVLNELYAMDDRTLSDIGLTRADIEDVVSGKLVRTPVDSVAANVEFLKRTTFAKTDATPSTDTKIAA